MYVKNQNGKSAKCVTMSGKPTCKAKNEYKYRECLAVGR